MSASPHTIRRVWAAYTAAPRASQREIADRVGCAVSLVNDALDALVAAGYLARADGKARAVTVIVPFCRLPAAPPHPGVAAAEAR